MQKLLKMPDYFNALIKQYTGALSDEQASRYAKSVVQAWYHSLDFNYRQSFVDNLPYYLKPSHQLFFFKLRFKIKAQQSELIFRRLAIELQKTDPVEVKQILKGFFKTLKILSDQRQKFNYTKFLDVKLQRLFIEA